MNPFGARARLAVEGGEVEIHRLDALEREGLAAVSDSPLFHQGAPGGCPAPAGWQRHHRGSRATAWPAGAQRARVAEVPFTPGRVLMQDFTGVPAVVDLAAMRRCHESLGGDPERINPLIPWIW